MQWWQPEFRSHPRALRMLRFGEEVWSLACDKNFNKSVWELRLISNVLAKSYSCKHILGNTCWWVPTMGSSDNWKKPVLWSPRLENVCALRKCCSLFKSLCKRPSSGFEATPFWAAMAPCGLLRTVWENEQVHCLLCTQGQGNTFWNRLNERRP